MEFTADFDEYGVNLTTTAQPPAPGYGWVGKAARATTVTGLMVMGARFYNPATGRFLTTDPVPGGGPNPYTYPPDPVNGYDLDGAWSIGGMWGAVTSVVASTVQAAASTVSRAWQGAKNVYHAVRATATRVVRTVVRATRTVYRAAKTVARKVVDKVRAGASPRRRTGSATTAAMGGHDLKPLVSNKIGVKLDNRQTGNLATVVQNAADIMVLVDAVSSLVGLRAAKRGKAPSPFALGVFLAESVLTFNLPPVAEEASRIHGSGGCSAFSLNRFGPAMWYGVEESAC